MIVLLYWNCIGYVMVRKLIASVVDLGLSLGRNKLKTMELVFADLR